MPPLAAPPNKRLQPTKAQHGSQFQRATVGRRRAFAAETQVVRRQLHRLVRPVRVYLDTNVVSRLVDLRVSAERARAYAILADAPSVRFVTSDKAREEVRRATDQQKTAVLQLLVSFLDKVQSRTLEHSGAYGEGAYGEGPYGGGWTDPVYQKLKTIFDPADAAHIAHAVHSKCDYFLTLDQRTILDRVEQHQAIVNEACGGMQFVTPEQLVQQLQGLS